MKRATIRCQDRRFPFRLQVTASARGVKFERTDDTTESKFLVLNSSVKSARKLAQWILDNTEE